ncbi:hypothetical protein GM418_31200 [Maribellus comscasis]|uniref:SGNH/GDSL hydrolase family protein n=1 Tax=Maribellus comscasis TaxID=2681766 RepID=A0A6I6K8J4_9BACT|nr:SGNH/GDSL hydrolase family protein [Maribellus comscasis]QGY47963.1 hypothetical protein GM418_31200 [Maribellus comscasis]
MRRHYYLIISLFLFLLSGNVFSQSDEKADNKIGLTADGGTWGFFQAKETKDSCKHVLLIGDSVMHGYHQFVINGLNDVACVDRWTTGMHLNSKSLIEKLAELVSVRNYDVIHFNIGLHGWQKGRIPKGQYVPLLEKYILTIQQYAPKAKLIWASTTPVTEQDKPVLNKDINPIIFERNALAASVMKEHGVAINDLYGLLVEKLDLARLDRFHWFSDGYRLMSDQIISSILSELSK